MRKLQLDTVVRRAAIAYGGTKSEAELREVRAARCAPPCGGWWGLRLLCWAVLGVCQRAPFIPPATCLPAPRLTYPPGWLQLASKDPSGVIREAILEEASEEAQQAYTDAQSRAKDVEMLVR
jgi:hypothetical protein